MPFIEDLNAKQKVGYWSSVTRQNRERWYISFNCANSYIPDYKGKRAPYVRYVWPVLFKSRDLAETAVSVLPVFANSEAVPGRGRIKSVSVEKTTIAP